VNFSFNLLHHNYYNAHQVNVSILHASFALVQGPRALRTALVVRRERLFLDGTVQRRTSLPSAHRRRVGAYALGAPVRMRPLARRSDLITQQTASSRWVHQFSALACNKPILPLLYNITRPCTYTHVD